MKVKLLCIGDIVGRPGRQILADKLGHLVKEHEIDCVIANAENVSGGSGITVAAYKKLMSYGINVITLGDHIYRKREIIEVLQNSDSIARPANLSGQAAGREWAVYTTDSGVQIAVIPLLGRLFMSLPGDNPFQAIQRVLSKIPPDIKIIVLDMHAEATSEKIAMGWFLDGRVSVIFGTHTHVQTADETVLPGGTAYITDLGMTGPHDSVLGRSKEAVIKSLSTQMPFPYGVATGDLRLNAAIITVDSNTTKALDIERLCVRGTCDQLPTYSVEDGKPANNSGHF